MHGRIIELTPSRLKEILKQIPIAYVAVSPIEWHGSHLPLGADAMRAQWVMEQAWSDVGGVLLPTEYCGTDGLYNKDGNNYWYLETVAEEKLIGNFLIDEFHFSHRVINLVENVKRNGFKLLVICTGHLSPQQISLLENIEERYRDDNFNVILWNSEKVVYPKELTTEDYLHAGVEETSEMMYIKPQLVSIDKLGEENSDVKLGLVKELEYKTSRELGEKRLFAEKQQLIKKIKDVLEEL